MDVNNQFKGTRVLLLDGYGRQIPSVLKQLHDLGCVITTVNDSKLDIGYCSKYPTHKIVEPGVKEDSEIIKRVIDRELESGKYDVVFPMLEKATKILTSNREHYSQYAKVIAAPDEAFEMAYNKQLTLETCMRIGIPCPLTKKDSETLDEYLANAKFPLALKPRKGTGSVGFARIDDKETLMELLNSGRVKVEEYVIQEFVANFTQLKAAYVVMDRNFNAKTTVAGQVFRWYPVDGGPGCFVQTINDQKVIDDSVRLLKELKWTGFAHVSYIIDPVSGSPKLMEINGRIPAGVKICTLVGAKPVQQLLELAYDLEVTDFTSCRSNGECLRYFHTDLLWLLKSPNRFKVKPGWFDFRKNSDYIFTWADPLPFFGYAVSHAKSLKKDMQKRNRKL